MGGNSSKSTVEQTNEFFNQQTNSFMSSLNQTVSATGSTIQTIDASHATFDGCYVDMSQNATTILNASGTLTSDNLQQLTSTLSNSANTAIDNMASQRSGFLAPQIMNSAEAQTNLKNKVSTTINNTMQSSTVQSILANAKNYQNKDLSHFTAKCYPEFHTPGEFDYVFDQNIMQSATAKGIADAITKSLVDNTEVNSMVTGIKQTSNQENSGLDDLVKAITDGWWIILVVCGVIFLFIVLMMFMGKKGNQGSAQN
jgi:hypothetical protein